MTTDLTSAWAQIEEMVDKHNPKKLPALNPPATEQELQELKEKLGFDLPEDLLESLRIHNGELEFLGLTLTLDCERIAREYELMMKLNKKFPEFSRHSPDPAVNEVFFDSKWIPIAADGGGNLWCMDLNPTDQGKKEQIIFWDHEGQCDVEADTLANFLVRQADEVPDDADWLEDEGVLSVEY